MSKLDREEAWKIVKDAVQDGTAAALTLCLHDVDERLKKLESVLSVDEHGNVSLSSLGSVSLGKK